MIQKVARRVGIKLSQIGRFPNLDLENTGAPTCVIGNALPKCGTYLLNSILKYLDKWADTGIHLTDACTFDFRNAGRAPLIAEPPLDVMRHYAKPGQIYAGHLSWHNGLSKELQRRPFIRHVFMVRDPRDACISYMRYATSHPVFTQVSPNERVRVLMEDFLTSDDDRLFYAILRYFLIFNWDPYIPWMSDASTYFIRFEDLYTEVCDAEQVGFGPVLCGLFKHLGYDDAQLNPKEFAAGVLGAGRTSTGEKNKVAQYKRVFKPRHLELIDNEPFQRLLKTWGYEES